MDNLWLGSNRFGLVFIEHVRPGEYDAILMDIQMPHMNGYEATKAIRRSKNLLGRTIPIIAMTANAFSDDVQNSFAAGMNAHVSKPIDMAVLEKTLRGLLWEGKYMDLLILFVGTSVVWLILLRKDIGILNHRLHIVVWVLLCIIWFVVGNLHYLFVYLPNRSEYKETSAVIYDISRGRRRASKKWDNDWIDVGFKVDGQKKEASGLEYAFDEHKGDKIRIAYREQNGVIQDVSRSHLVFDTRTVISLISLFWICVICLFGPDEDE